MQTITLYSFLAWLENRRRTAATGQESKGPCINKEKITFRENVK